MPLSSPDGYLDFTNAVPRAVKMVATSNVGIGTSSPKYALDVHGTSNTGPLTVSSLTIADGAIVGDVSISGNLALTSNVTTSVDSNVVVEHKGPHGRGTVPLRKYPEIVFDDTSKMDMGEGGTTNGLLFKQAGYTITASSTHSSNGRVPYRAFNGDHTTGWICASGSWNSTTNVYQGGRGIGGYSGEWIKLEVPQKIKVETMYIEADLNSERRPLTGKLLGSDDDSSWEIIKNFTNIPNQDINTLDIGSTVAYKYIAFLTETVSGGDTVWIDEIEYYGYEEDPPAGDTSIDTTFTSVMNTPQTTGANVYVDGNLGETFTNHVTGPTPTGTATTYNETGKYWELTGALTSNVTVEANTFLEGDQPHAVSVWFNSSDLGANVSNTCVFSVSDQEKLDSVNLNLQSNTWHNLTYAYQGEGGSRVTYLDGRKVSEDQAEDTFGDYPPFAMTGYSQGGYVVSQGGVNYSGLEPWELFDKSYTSNQTSWAPRTSDGTLNYTVVEGSYKRYNTTLGTATRLSGDTEYGEYVKLELPDKIRLNYIVIHPHPGSTDYATKFPAFSNVYGSNDDVKWTEITNWTPNDFTLPVNDSDEKTFIANATKSYKYLALVVTGVGGTTHNETVFNGLQFYGHRENDLVRLPDPTHVLKYPHIRITNTTDADGLTYAIRGYEFSRSYSAETMANWYDEDTSNFSTFGPGNYNGSASGAAGATTGSYNGTTNLGGTVGGVSGQIPDGEWHKIKMPHRIILTKLNIVPRITQPISAPYEWRLYGSNDDSDWTLLYNKNDTSTIPDNASGADYSITTSTAFKYFAIVMIKSVNYAYLNVGEFKWYGTGVDSVPIQIGGGNIDKVANFRVYDKFIDEDQALEIWDAQKDEFGRAKSSMTLHKGRLGIGTTEPEGRLAVLDEPHNLEEFPPSAMTGNKTYIEGHGEFCTNASNTYQTGQYESYKAFNKNSTGTTGNWWSQSDIAGVPTYSTSTGEFSSTDSSYSTNVEGVTKYGHWLQIEFPYKINYRYSNIEGVHHSLGRQPRAGYILGSNDLTGMWTSLHKFTNVTRTYKYKSVRYTPPTVSTQTFKYFRLVIEEQDNYLYAGIARWDIFGTREQGQSVLHDGQLTLTKNLDVPRIGPALDADDTPRRDRLVVEYNTSTNPTFEGAVRDTSGRGNDGVFVGTASYDATEKALVFDGNSDYVVSGDLGIPSGAFVHSVSLWCKRDSQGSNMYLSSIGGENDATLTSRFSMMLLANAGTIHLSISGSNSTFTGDITVGSWFHIVYTYNGGAQGSSSTAHTVYVNGIEKPINGGVNAMTLNLPENSRVALGSQPWGGSNYFDGSISNFKLYDKILTAEEVKTLYDMGRCDEGHHVVNFSKTRVGIGLGDGEAPYDDLDVRGNVRGSDNVIIGPYGGQWWRLYTFQHNGNLGFLGEDGTEHGYLVDSGTVNNIDFTGQHRSIIDKINVSDYESLEGLIVSANKNKYINVDKDLTTGSNAIQISQSLPVVSLSNVVHDKACYGVISGSEDPESRTYEQGTFVSVFHKQKGDTRAIINSVGEGAIWVVNTNGSLESGDYITTSNVAGYGQKQDSEFLANYTVAKITMDCDFEPATQPVQQILRSNVVETYYLGNVHHTKTVPHEFVTTVVGADDEWSNVSISPSDVTYAEWSNLEANTQNTYTLTYTQTSNVVYDVKYTLTTTANVTESDPWDSVFIDPPDVTYAEYSNLEANTQNTYTLTFTQTTTDEKTPEEWSALESNTQSLYNKVYYQSVEEEVASDYPGAVAHTRVTDRIENELDEHGQIQWEDHPTETEKAYKIRYLDASGTQTDEANAVHIAAFVGCTYHCG